MSDIRPECMEQYPPLVDVAIEWSVEEQIELAQEWDEHAAVAREENHPVYTDLRVRAFELRRHARDVITDN